jgi:hypothetical protein
MQFQNKIDLSRQKAKKFLGVTTRPISRQSYLGLSKTKYLRTLKMMEAWLLPYKRKEI